MERVSFERIAYEHIKNRLIEAQAELGKHDIHSNCKFESLGKSSEIHVDFFKYNEWVDSLYFFVFYNDEQNITLNEIDVTFDETLQKLL